MLPWTLIAKKKTWTFAEITTPHRVWNRVYILRVMSEIGYGKSYILVWNRVRVFRTGRHTPAPGPVVRRVALYLMSRANGRPECPLCFANAAWREISIAPIVAQPLSCIKCYWISGPIAEPIGNCGELCSSAFINIGSTAYMKLFARSRWGGSSLTGVFILAEVWSVGWMFSSIFFHIHNRHIYIYVSRHCSSV